MHDKNTKEHLKNKVNQKDLPQLITNISALHFHSNWRTLREKYLANKKTKGVKTEGISFITKQGLHPYMSIP